MMRDTYMDDRLILTTKLMKISKHTTFLNSTDDIGLFLPGDTWRENGYRAIIPMVPGWETLDTNSFIEKIWGCHFKR